MTSPKPPGVHPLAWDVVRALRSIRHLPDSVPTILRLAFDAWTANGQPLLDDEPQADAERAQVVRWLRKEAKLYRKQPVWRSLDTDSIVSGESAAEALEDVADEIERGEHAKEQP